MTSALERENQRNPTFCLLDLRAFRPHPERNQPAGERKLQKPSDPLDLGLEFSAPPYSKPHGREAAL